MNAGIEENNIVFRNMNGVNEKTLFKCIVSEFGKSDKVIVKAKVMGPSENVIEVECNSGKVCLIYDIDYGMMPIECTKNNIDIIFDIVQKGLIKYSNRSGKNQW